MKLSIQSSTKIAEYQKVFSDQFPYLKIDFFAQPTSCGRTAWLKYSIPNRQERFGELVGFTANDAPFEASKTLTVAQFEQKMYEHYGVIVQVFRKSMGSWLITSVTENWTLDAQNKKGAEATARTEWFYRERINESNLV